MSEIVKKVESDLKSRIMEALGRAVAAEELPPEIMPAFIIERPQNRANGDLSANAALVGAKAFKMPPRKIAEIIEKNIDLQDSYFEKLQVAGPGFLNFTLSGKYYSDILYDVLNKGESYGTSDYGSGKRVLVEFVSANPTGPMHIGNARGGAIGDCLASILQAAGFKVDREFYINDAGNQIAKFGMSLEVRYLQHFGQDVEMPEDAYHGADITEHAENFAAEYGDKYVNAPTDERRQALVDYALPKNIEGLEHDLLEYKIKYDNWFHESSLYEAGSVQEIIDKLKAMGATYEKDGALWFKASEYGNDKDIVIVRSNGYPTYIVPDIAYHYNKLVTRGYDKAIDVLGADHHGYVPRMRAALRALGFDDSRLDFVIYQMVRLVRGGEVVKLSKRSGKAITLNTLLEEIPIDAARFFFNLRETNSHFEFDLDLAVEESSQNPVYYVQYAHARICSVLKKAEEAGIDTNSFNRADFDLLVQPEERELLAHLAALTGEIVDAAKEYEPAKLTRYVMELATLFHKFYGACKVISDDKRLTSARLQLCRAVKNVIKIILDMFKITAPKSM